jgi:hypothetical protein
MRFKGGSVLISRSGSIQVSVEVISLKNIFGFTASIMMIY